MPAFYEIHDSILENLEWNGAALELTLHAVCTLSDSNAPLAWGRQRIVLRIEPASITGDKFESEIWLLDGEFNCGSQVSKVDDQIRGCIAASLKEAQDIHLLVAGMNEDTQEYLTFDIRGESMTLLRQELVEWSAKDIPIVESPMAQSLGIDAFDCRLT